MEKIIGFYGGKFLPMHIGHIYSILYSASKCDELHVFLFTNSFNEEKYIEESKFPKELLTSEIRELILKYEFENHNNIITHVIDCKKEFVNLNNNGWDYNSSAVIDKAKCLPNIIFSSESEQEKHFKIIYPFAKFELIDQYRSMFNISSSKIRKEGAFTNWDYIPKSYKSLNSKSIVILGEKNLRERLISDLSKIFMTSFVDSIESTEEEVRKKVFDARYNSNKIFFINSADTYLEKYVAFYKINNYRFSINFSEEDKKNYNTINLKGKYCDVLYQAVSMISSIILT